MTELVCPACQNEEQKTFAGYEIRGVYDGVLFWVCTKCDHAFQRDFGQPMRNLHSISRFHADEYNKREELK